MQNARGITSPRPDSEKLGDYYKSEDAHLPLGQIGLMGLYTKVARQFIKLENTES